MKHIALVPMTLGLTAAFAVAGPVEETAPAGDWVTSLSVGASHTRLEGVEVADSEANDFLALDLQYNIGTQIGDKFLDFIFFGEITQLGDSNDDSYSHGAGLAAHLSRETSYGSAGVFAGAFMTKQDPGGTDDTDRFFFGLETSLDGGFADYDFQVGYLFGKGGDDSSGLDSLHETYFLRAVATKQLTDRTALSLEGGYAIGETDSDSDDLDIVSVGIALTHRCSDNLVAALSYDYTNYRQAESGLDEVYEQILGLSITYSFGAGAPSSAKDLDLPRFLRWSSTTGGPLE